MIPAVPIILGAESQEPKMHKSLLYIKAGGWRDSLVVESTGCIFRDLNSIFRTHVAAHTYLELQFQGFLHPHIDIHLGKST